MKKLIDRIIEKLYVKRFPERCGKFPLPDIISVNMKRYAPTTLIAEFQISKREIEECKISPEFIRRELTEKISKGLEKDITIETDYFLDNVIYRGSIKILKEEA